VRPAHGEPDSKAVDLSVRLFERLLAAYPQEHRREYGPAMAQLFRDQCRDAWHHGRGWGLTGLWLRILPDLVKTSVLEHLSTFKERKTMLERISSLLPPRSAPRRVFIRVFGAVFLIVVATSSLVTFILPESYSSTARVKLNQDASEANRTPSAHVPVGRYDPYFLKAQFEVIESEAVLGKVIDALDLNQAWGKKYAGGSPLKTSETLALLKGRIDLRPIRNTTLVQICVFSDDPSEAAKLANAIARTYQERRLGIQGAEIVDLAVPGLRPVRPNKPLNIAMGILGGLLLALVAGAGIAGIAAWLGRRSCGAGAPPPTGEVPPPAVSPTGAHPATNTLDRVTGILWMGIGGLLFGVALLFLLWFLTLRQSDVTAELLALPLFGLIWGGNAVLGFLHFRGNRGARICLGVEGVLLLAYYGFRYGFLFPHGPAWISNVIIHLGWLMVGLMPYILRWVFIPLALVSICALLWPRKTTAPNPC
jgi:capsular polysaccharide biosynthesis protein